jgi:hypothetical protein
MEVETPVNDLIATDNPDLDNSDIEQRPTPAPPELNLTMDLVMNGLSNLAKVNSTVFALQTLQLRSGKYTKIDMLKQFPNLRYIVSNT